MIGDDGRSERICEERVKRSRERRSLTRKKAAAASDPCALVVGSGCVGTYLACKLNAAGVQTILKGRDRQNKPPSPLQSRVGALCKEAGVRQITSFNELSAMEFDYLFLTTKTYDYQAVAEELTKFKVTAKVMVAIHNGIILYPFDHKPVVQVVIPQSYDIMEDTDTKCGYRMVVRNEEKPWTLPSIPAARKAVSVLLRAGIHAEANPTFEVPLLRKYVINGVANLLSVVADTNCAGLCRNHWDRMQGLYNEFMIILEHTFPNGFRELPENFHSVVFNGLASYGKHYPSTKHDFDAGKPIEINSLNGFLLHCGQKLGIALPHNERLVSEVKEVLAQRDAPVNSTLTD